MLGANRSVALDLCGTSQCVSTLCGSTLCGSTLWFKAKTTATWWVVWSSGCRGSFISGLFLGYRLHWRFLLLRGRLDSALKLPHLSKEIWNQVKHGPEGLALGILSHEVIQAEEVSEFGLGHDNLRSGILLHEHVIGLVHLVHFEELSNKEPRVVFSTEVFTSVCHCCLCLLC